MTVAIERRIIRWGNGYGLRLTASEVQRLGVHEGAVVHADLSTPAAVKNDFAKAVLFHSKTPYDVRAILEEDFGGGRR